MSGQMPWSQSAYKGPGRRRRKKKKVKRKAKKKAVRKKAKKVVRRKKKAARSRRQGDRFVVSKAEFSRIRKAVARPRWMDLLEEGKRKTFAHDGGTYWPVFSLLYAVDAVEVVPLRQWKKPTHKIQGDRFRAGFVKKLGSGTHVFVKRAQFILRGSPLDV